MVSIDTKATGNNIKKLIKQQGITVSKLQHLLGFGTPQAIYKWLNGTHMPNIDNLFYLADILGCKVDQIVVTNNSEESVIDD